jgi:hypothetical protein
MGFIEAKEEISVDYEGSTIVEMHDGSKLALSKIDEQDHDVSDALAAQQILFKAKQEQKFATGLFYFNKGQENLVQQQNLSEQALCSMGVQELRPPAERLDAIMDDFA